MRPSEFLLLSTADKVSRGRSGRHPAIENAQGIEARVEVSAAVTKAGDEIEAHKVVHLLARHQFLHPLVVKHRGVGGNGRIAGSVQHEELSAVLREARQIGIACVGSFWDCAGSIAP